MGRGIDAGPIDDPADKIARLVGARDAARERYFDAIEELHLGLRGGCRRRERKRLLEVACQKRDEWVDRAGEAQRAKADAYDGRVNPHAD